MQNIIVKYVLVNQLKYGKADMKSVVSKVFSERPTAKKNAKSVVSDVKKTIKKYEKLTTPEIEVILADIAPEMLEKKKKVVEKKELPELENIKAHPKFRLPPEPNGYLHIGHGLSFMLNYLYAQKYGGKLVLKLEDNNPTTTKSEFYGEIQRDLHWLGIKWDEMFIISEHFSELENAAKRLINLDKSYVCNCPSEKISLGRRNKIADHCRTNTRAENLELWDQMKSGKKLILRWKGNPEDDNSVMRDPTLYRVMDEVHPWTGENHRVYPTYDLASAASDGILKITDVLRSEEFLMRVPLHKEIIRALGYKAPNYVHFGRFRLDGTPTSKRKIRPLVESKKVLGWDDPRLATLMGLRRRGIVPETIRDLAIATGPHLGISTIDRKLLEGYNRKHLDPVAERYFILKNPIKLKLKGEKNIAKLNKLPGNEAAGFRYLKAGEHIWIEKDDFKKNEGKLLRLKGLYNVELSKKKMVEVRGEPIRPIIHWLSEYVEGELLLIEPKKDGELNESLTKIKVFAEPEIVNAKTDIIQMERFGYAHIESHKPLKMVFISK